jgi:hypothetical protein
MNTKAEILLAAVRLDAIREVLMIITADGATDKQAGRKALLLSYLLEPGMIGTQRQLARRMGVSPGRCSQMLTALRRCLAR